MIQEGFVPLLGYRTWYRSVGSAAGGKVPLLLLHGGPGSTHDYFEVLDHLAEEDDRRIVTYDQLGCGRSYLDGHPELWRMETWLRELETVRDALGLREVVLLGQSWGGMLALEYLCNHPHLGVKGVVLSSTLPSSRLWGEEQHRLLAELPPEMRAAIADALAREDFTGEAYKAAEAEYMLRHAAGAPGPDAPECLTRPKRYGKESYQVAWGPNEFTPMGTLKDFDVVDKLAAVDVPALILSGGNDLCTPYIAKLMYDRIPRSRWELFRTARHMCFVEAHNDYVATLRDWLREIGA